MGCCIRSRLAAPFLPLAGGTVTGATSIGAGSTNCIQISGASSNPMLTVAGAGTNGALLLQSQGHGAINLRNSTGGLMMQLTDASTTSIGNYLHVAAQNAGTAISITPQDATAGITFSGGPIVVNRSYAYSGTAGSSNSVLGGTWIISGTAADTAYAIINNIQINDGLLATHNNSFSTPRYSGADRRWLGRLT